MAHLLPMCNTMTEKEFELLKRMIDLLVHYPDGLERIHTLLIQALEFDLLRREQADKQIRIH